MKRRWNDRTPVKTINFKGMRGLDVLNEPVFVRKSIHFSDDWKTAQKRARYIPDNPYMVLLKNIKNNEAFQI